MSVFDVIEKDVSVLKDDMSVVKKDISNMPERFVPWSAFDTLSERITRIENK
jgi:hypothetical protein